MSWDRAGILRRAASSAGVLDQEADLTVVRGLLNLECGDAVQAAVQFRHALSIAPGATSARPIARQCLGLLTAGEGQDPD